MEYTFRQEADPLDRSNLSLVTDSHVSNYLRYRAFGTEAPDAGAFPSKNARSGTLKGLKKKLSAFMPRRTIAWDNVSKQGNPTRSEAVAEVIAQVMQFEVHRVFLVKLEEKSSMMNLFKSWIS